MDIEISGMPMSRTIESAASTSQVPDPPGAEGATRTMPATESSMSERMSTNGQATPSAHFVSSMIIGVWLVTSPFALGYVKPLLTTSDVTSGILVIVFATITLRWKSSWAPWASSLVGVWLLFAPLVFKSPIAAAYANDTLTGALVISFVILMPGMPAMNMAPGPDNPRGWSYNPSSWSQRIPIIALAFVGFFLSRQMAAYQLGYTRIVWEPFFHPGTVAVITSKLSRSFPISDAGLGAVAYMIEALMGFMGDKRRWRTMPWMVAFFGILVVPLGIASISLIIMQPVSVGQWCTPCLVAAGAMVIMIALTLDEVVATCTFLAQSRREGQPFWRTFWLGGSFTEAEQTGLSTRSDTLSVKSMFWGVAVPWNLILCVALGTWLMFSPSVFGTKDLAAHSDHVLGALTITVAVIAMADVGRILRRINIVFGVWFIASPWILSGTSSNGRLSDTAVGVALILFSLRRGAIRDEYGTWQLHIR